MTTIANKIIYIHKDMEHRDKVALEVSYAILIIMAVTFIVFKFFGVGSAQQSLTAVTAFKNYNQTQVTINNHQFKAYIADTPEKQSQGLSDITSMFPEEGMQFIYNTPAIYKFWMKDMNFNLDFVWIRDGKIVDLTENMSSDLIDQVKTISPKVPADSMLELNAGQIYKNGLKVGDEVVVNK
jgi:hypothetical protein